MTSMCDVAMLLATSSDREWLMRASKACVISANFLYINTFPPPGVDGRNLINPLIYGDSKNNAGIIIIILFALGSKNPEG